MGRDEMAMRARALLGTDPKTGEEISLKTGRFGPYVQLGNGEKPQRAGIPKASRRKRSIWNRRFVSCPCRARSGFTPKTEKPIVAGFGRSDPMST